jgi:hypothetical protein
LLIQHVAGGQREGKPETLKPHAGEPMSRSSSELDSASLASWDWPVLRASPPSWMKPDTGREAMSKHLFGPGVVGGSAWGKICRGTLRFSAWEALLGGGEARSSEEAG